MNRESKLIVLRETLELSLDRACSFMVQVNKTVKRLEDNRCLLTPKRDLALKNLEETYDEADMLLKNLYKSTERDILDIYRKKEALLVSDINELIRIINETAEVCGKIEESLQVGKENTLLQSGEYLDDKIERLLLSGKPTSEAELRDIMQLEFLPNESIRQRFGNKALLGYVKRSLTAPEEICVATDDSSRRPPTGLPQKRPVPSSERKRIVSRGALQGIRNHIKSNSLINQTVADAMMKEELPSPQKLKTFSQYSSQLSSSGVRIKEEPLSPPNLDDHGQGDNFTTLAENLIKEELSPQSHAFSFLNQQQKPETPTKQLESVVTCQSSMTTPSVKESSVRKEGRYIPPPLRGGGDGRLNQTITNTDEIFTSATTTGRYRQQRTLVNKCDRVQNWREAQEKRPKLVHPVYWENSVTNAQKEMPNKDVQCDKKKEKDTDKQPGKDGERFSQQTVKQESKSPSGTSDIDAELGTLGKSVASLSLCKSISEVKLHTKGKVEHVESEDVPKGGNSNVWKEKIKPDSFTIQGSTGDRSSFESHVAHSNSEQQNGARSRHSRMRFPRADQTSGKKPDHNNNTKETLPKPSGKQFQGFGVSSAFEFNFSPDTAASAKEANTGGGEQKDSNSNSGMQGKKSVIEKNLNSGVKVMKAEFIRQIGRPGSRELNFPIGVTTTKNKVIVCNSGADNVKVFDWGGTEKTLIRGDGFEKFSKPSAVVADEEENLYIKDNKYIWVFTIVGKFLKKFGSDVLRRPYGLVFNSQGDLVVLNYDYREVYILVFSKSGNLMKRSVYTPISSFDLRSRSRCRFLDIIPSEDILVVSDLGVSEVFVTDLYGKQLWRFGQFGSMPGQFREPSGVAADSCGNLVIADSKNDRIQVFSRTGDFLAAIMVERERPHRPSDICLTPEGYLLVSNLLGHSVNIYKIKDSSVDV